MLKVVVGHSENINELEAAREVINQIVASLAGKKPQAGILFCSVDFNHALLLSVIRSAFPAIALVGCTTDGELSSVAGFAEDSLTLMVFASDMIGIHAGVGREVVSRGERITLSANTCHLLKIKWSAPRHRVLTPSLRIYCL